MSYEHPIEQQICEIDVYACGDEFQFFSVGKKDVTRIEACEKSGMHSSIPYVRVWAGEVCLAEFCQHNIIGIYFAKGDAA